MSISAQTGLNVSVSDPLIRANRNALGIRLSRQLESYSQEIRFLGGYWAASIRMNIPESQIDNWLSKIASHVETRNRAGVVIFQGFINSLNIRFGEAQYKIGPLVDITTEQTVVYSVIDSSVAPPVVGGRDTTPVATNAASKALYGTWQKQQSSSGETSASAKQLRDMLINDPSRAFPAVSGDLSLRSSGVASVSIQILGYWHWFMAYLYSNATPGGIDLSQKIINIMTASPNAIFSSDISKITTNNFFIMEQMEKPVFAAKALLDLNKKGFPSQVPAAIGIYNDQRLVYEPASTTIRYYKRRGRQFTDRFGGVVQPWDIRPNNWVIKPDLLAGSSPPISAETLGKDLRTSFIKVVKYSTPYTLSIKGDGNNELDTALARRGLGSIG